MKVINHTTGLDGLVSRKSSKTGKSLGTGLLGTLLLLLTIFTHNLTAQEATGKIIGKLIAGDTREPLIFANVVIDGQLLGAASDMDGVFLIENVPTGIHTVVVTIVGYGETRIPNITVEAGKVATLDDITVKSETIEGDAVEVLARVIQNNEAALLSQRKKSGSISDALSAEAISQAGSGEAADAMQQVTGASVLDGKYVYVRGLGDRYASTQLNGVELPSADPDKRSFQLDLIPAKMLDNIVTLKTFTPNKPGNFSGGLVDLGTRSYPEQLEISISTGTSWNSESSLNSNVLSQPKGSTDWLGFDDGSRELPAVVANTSGIPSVFDAEGNAEAAQVLDQVSKAFNSNMAPVTEHVPVNSSFSMSVGNQVNLWGRPLGFLASLSYKRSFSFYDNESYGNFRLKGSVDSKDELDPEATFVDSQGKDDVLWGAIGTLSYEPFAGQQFQLNYMRTQSGSSSSRFLTGEWQAQNVENFETRALQYSERALKSLQFRGNHSFNSLGSWTMNWIGSYSTNKLNEPDTRFFSDTYAVFVRNGRDTTLYSIPEANFDPPSRYFRDMDETGKSVQWNLEKPLALGSSFVPKLKFGYNYEEKDRQFNERLFEYIKGSATARYQGDPDSYFGSGNTGIVEVNTGSSNPYRFGNYIREGLTGALGSVGDYSGVQRINAFYVMADVPVNQALRVIGGMRYEATRMNVTNGIDSGKLNDDDLLPALSINYQFVRDQFLRAAYGRTLARPNFREKAPYASFSFVGDVVFNGNPDLQRTLIDNYDLRWEWYMAPGEIISVSGYYKNFQNPIERVIDEDSGGDNDVVFFQNVDKAEVYGLEFEFRKRLGFIASPLNSFTLNTNLSLTGSKVTIPEDELPLILNQDPNASNTRQLLGQSPYLLNVGLGYEKTAWGTSVNASYNTFGDRLYEVAIGATPDVFERSRHTVDLNIRQHLLSNLSVKVGVKNLLNEKTKFSYEYKNQEFLRRLYRTGREVGLSFTYEL